MPSIIGSLSSLPFALKNNKRSPRSHGLRSTNCFPVILAQIYVNTQDNVQARSKFFINFFKNYLHFCFPIGQIAINSLVLKGKGQPATFPAPQVSAQRMDMS